VRAGGTGGRGEAAAAQAACRQDPTAEAAGGARAERTENMFPMSVTLDVSKLSDWLNADAPCRAESKGKHGKRGDMWAGGHGLGERRRQRAEEDPTVEAASRARAERTRNMLSMLVTLDVSRLSG